MVFWVPFCALQFPVAMHVIIRLVIFFSFRMLRNTMTFCFSRVRYLERNFLFGKLPRQHIHDVLGLLGKHTAVDLSKQIGNQCWSSFKSNISLKKKTKKKRERTKLLKMTMTEQQRTTNHMVTFVWLSFSSADHEQPPYTVTQNDSFMCL